MSYDLVIRGGTVVDGSGLPRQRADVAVQGDRIAAVGRIHESGSEEIDAEGHVVAPGFVDLHTHMDAQVCWDPLGTCSSWHGVTSVVMGNCGVGFAPARPDRHQFLIELMEGVEDIPGTALHDGMNWDWETFPQYLDALEKLPRAIEVGAQVPHGSVRAYVMDERAHELHAPIEDVKTMARIAREGIEAGAVGFSTNRLPLHTSIHGDPVPGTFANEQELLEIVKAFRATGQGILESVPAGAMGEDLAAPATEVELYRKISLETGCPITFSLAQIQIAPKHYVDILERVERANAEGAQLIPQVSGRPAGLLMSWETFNPFMGSPTYQSLAGQPLADRVKALREPGTRQKILEEAGGMQMSMLTNSYDTTFALRDGPVYEPDPDTSIQARAERQGVDPNALVYDEMLDLAGAGVDGKPGFLHVWFAGYKGGSLEDIGAMMTHPESVVGLADGGAHCSMICDASMPTYVLEHWVRDRTRGPKLPVEDAVKMLTQDPADLYDLHDRGRIEVGKRADLNVIDLDGLTLHTPEIVNDLPTGAPRVVQRGEGYDATIVAGEVTFRKGEDTGARPGGLIRGPQT